jgi:hypothetical protein
VYASDTSFGHSWLRAEPVVKCDRLHRSFVTSSFVSATLDAGGWLGLTRRGLAPRKRRQASPGAHHSIFKGKWGDPEGYSKRKHARKEAPMNPTLILCIAAIVVEAALQVVKLMNRQK